MSPPSLENTTPLLAEHRGLTWVVGAPKPRLSPLTLPLVLGVGVEGAPAVRDQGWDSEATIQKGKDPLSATEMQKTTG